MSEIVSSLKTSQSIHSKPMEDITNTNNDRASTATDDSATSMIEFKIFSRNDIRRLVAPANCTLNQLFEIYFKATGNKVDSFQVFYEFCLEFFNFFQFFTFFSSK